MESNEILHFSKNSNLEKLALILPSFCYSPAAGEEASMILMVPQVYEKQKYPLVVFVQGSGFTTGNPWYEIPQLCQLAQRGFVVATVNHRSTETGNPFPAYLQDVKCAIRYLRANSEKYGIDPDRVCIFGTSSGGNTALMAGITGDSPIYKTDEYAEQSDKVQLVVDCFGPTDMKDVFRIVMEPERYPTAFGPDESLWDEKMLAVSPLYLLEKGEQYPPFLLLHGTEDPLVPLWHTEKMYERLLECGADAQMVLVDHAGHEWDFWSQPLWNQIFEYIEKKL